MCQQKIKETPVIRFDWAIKYLLRDKANFDVLEGFLSAVLNRDIQILQILESESNQYHDTDKFNRVDLLAENQAGEKLIIEVQNNREVHYLERLLYGTSRLIVDNMKLGYPYKAIKKVISINILYFFLGESLDDYVYYGKTEFRGIHSHQLLKLKRKQQDTLTTLESYKIFPEYYLIEVEKFQDVINSDLDEWIYFLKHEAIRDDFKAKNINKAKEKLDYLKLPDTKRKDYERYMENLAREKDMIDSAHEDGKAEGKIETAQKMRKDGLELALISKYTGLSIAEIKQLDVN
ncbi:Rpn family recombination-promoting nuclease/putative transposase [Candidatus Venteria ishoeyi]|uniref:PD-(D/E)XK nuclease family transposase n=1 Tax=Candidatus Venteria ishoeyi TaxID=1899563 RepID=A0A1H6FIX2_9GAMM|nr:Rpn family recombination-promoting nuclease/putative transposase [Candidatus Venteria ishoeyi]SEH09056.1 PD-(D/E)XK nuclease family transposase [Candidatus Venteria ishoeyi]